MDRKSKLTLLSAKFKDKAAIKQAIHARELSPVCTSEGTQEVTTRCSAISLAFPNVLNKWKLCLPYVECQKIILKYDGMLEALRETKFDFTRTIELFNVCGGLTQYIAQLSSHVVSFESNIDRFLSTVNNVSVLIAENLISARVHLVEKAPNPENAEVFEIINHFKPTCFVFNVPWERLEKNGILTLRMDHHTHHLTDLAAKLLPIAPVIFLLPPPSKYNAPFTVSPLNISRRDVVRYSLYAVSNIEQLRKTVATDPVPNISIKSIAFTELAEIKKEIVYRNLIPISRDETYDRKIQALKFAFGELPDSVLSRLAIEESVIPLLNSASDGILDKLKGLDLSRVFDVYAGIGNNTFAFLRNGSATMSNTGRKTRYACLVNNILRLRKSGEIPAESSARLTSLPFETALEESDTFKPTLFFVSVLMSGAQPRDGEYLLHGNSKDYKLDELARMILSRSAAGVFLVPEPEGYRSPFKVSPITIPRADMVLRLYIIKKVSDIA